MRRSESERQLERRSSPLARAEEPEPEVEVEAAEEVVSEPKKVRKKAEPAPADDADLADIVDSLWDE